jgi:hypothetical protein
MSTLVAQTISNGTVSTSTANVVSGCLKAWVNFDASGNRRISYNVSSVTVNSTGDYWVNFTTAMSSVNYCANYSVNIGSTEFFPFTITYETTRIRVRTIAENSIAGNASINCVSVVQ